eukprot:m.166444 g.166444  ORF g.166444 m.166444 type:complete len:226 (+) comp14705_c0_seq5:278-955(+)
MDVDPTPEARRQDSGPARHASGGASGGGGRSRSGSNGGRQRSGGGGSRQRSGSEKGGSKAHGGGGGGGGKKDRGAERAASGGAAAAAAAHGGAAAFSHGQRKKSGGKTDFAVLKRTPFHFPSGKTDLYISRNSDFQAQMSKAEKLLSQKYPSICIHGLGAAINRAINLAMQLQAKSPVPLVLSATTSTVPLVDDLIPTKDLLLKDRTQIRNNSAIHIELIKQVAE